MKHGNKGRKRKVFKQGSAHIAFTGNGKRRYGIGQPGLFIKSRLETDDQDPD